MAVVQAAVAAAVAVAAAAMVAVAVAMAALAAGMAAVVAAPATTTNWIGGRGFSASASWIRGVAGGIWACAIHGLGFDTG